MHSARRPITDSPWFWVYLFATAALIALAFISPKYGARQAQIEREFQGRQRAAQQAQGAEPSGDLSNAERTLITLRPLFLALAAITIAAWIVFWRIHMFQQRHSSTPQSAICNPHSAPEP
jgi:hypothetical protein